MANEALTIEQRAAAQGRWFRALAALLLTGVLGLAPLTALGAEELIFCGNPLARNLAGGAVDAYRFALPLSDHVIVDVSDTSGTIGVLRLRANAPDLFPPPETCSGVLPFHGAVGVVEVSDCIGGETGSYTINLNVVSESPDNCGAPLPCGSPLQGRSLDVPGAVNSYTFSAGDTDSDHATITVSDVSANIGALRLRVFDPEGSPVSGGDCSGSVTVPFASAGPYTVLVSACAGAGTGPYTLTRQQPTCPPILPKRPPRGPFAYVTVPEAAAVKVIDTATNDTVNVIPVGIAPTRIAITPNGAFAYVSDAGSGVLSVINTSTNVVTTTVPVGTEANGIAMSPDGAFAYVLANDLAGVVAIDTTMYRVTNYVPLGFGDRTGIAVSPDGKVVYVASNIPTSGEESTVSVIDAASKAVTATITIPGGNARYVAFSPSGAFAYATVDQGIVVIDAATNAVTNTISVSGGTALAIAFTFNGASAYVGNAASLVSVIDTATQTEITTVPLPNFPRGLALSLDGRFVYVAVEKTNPGAPGVVAINTANNAVEAAVLRGDDNDTSIDIAITSPPTGLCAGDAHGQAKVTIDEIVGAVNYALNGCPIVTPQFTPVP